MNTNANGNMRMTKTHESERMSYEKLIPQARIEAEGKI